MTLYFDGELLGAKQDAACRAGRMAVLAEGVSFRDLAWGEFPAQAPGEPPLAGSAMLPTGLLFYGSIAPTAPDQLSSVLAGKDTAGGAWRRDKDGWVGGRTGGAASGASLTLSPPIALHGSYRIDFDFTLPGTVPLNDVVLLLPLGNGRSVALRPMSTNLVRALFLAKSIARADLPMPNPKNDTRRRYKMAAEVRVLNGGIAEVRTSVPTGAAWSHCGTIEDLALPAGETSVLGEARALEQQGRVMLISHWPIVVHSLHVEPMDGGDVEKLRP